MLQAIATKLGHNNSQHLPFMSHDFEGSKGHVGVTEVKFDFSYKMLLLHRNAINWDVI